MASIIEWAPECSFQCSINSNENSKKKVELRFNCPSKRMTYMQALSNKINGNNEKKSRTTVERYDKELKKVTALLNEFYKCYDLELDSVKLRVINSGRTIITDKRKKKPDEFQFSVQQISEKMDIEVSDARRIQDVTKTSDKNYLIWRKTISNKHDFFPSLYSVRKQKIQLDMSLKLIHHHKGIQ